MLQGGAGALGVVFMTPSCVIGSGGKRPKVSHEPTQTPTCEAVTRGGTDLRIAKMNERIVLKTADGWELVGDLLLPPPEAGAPWGLALLGHAMMVDRRTMDRPRGAGLASTLAERGMAVLNVDFRGHGESVRPSQPRFSFDDIVRYDVPALLDALRDRFPTLPRFLVGHSLGVNAGLPGAAILPNHGLAGAVAFAPNLWSRRFEPSPLRRARKRLMLRGFDLLSRPTGFFDPSLMKLGKSKIPRAYIKQFETFWSAARMTSADGAHDYERALSQLEIPILAWSGAADTLMAHPDAVERYLRVFERADVKHVRWVGSDGWLPGHMGIVIDPRARPMFEASADFMARVAGRSSVASEAVGGA